MKRLVCAGLLIPILVLSACQGPLGSKPPTREAPAATTMADLSQMDLAISDTLTVPQSLQGAGRVVFGPQIRGEGNGIRVEGTTVTLSGGGTYVLTGTHQDARLVVDGTDSQKYTLVLQDLHLQSQSGPAMYIRQADTVGLVLWEGSLNSLSDTASSSLTDEGSACDGALFSRGDLIVGGTGSLQVTGAYKHGIVSKDDLVILDGQLRVEAQKVCLNGKDCVKIAGGQLVLRAGSDGVRSDNDQDAHRGYVTVTGGALAITSENDGIQAQTVLSLTGGSVMVQAGGGSANASYTSQGGFRPDWGYGGSASVNADTPSAKGLKAGDTLVIDGADVRLDCADDCLHANGDAWLLSGRVEAASGDDGIHADGTLTVKEGRYLISQSYEGLEGSHIRIQGGHVSVTARDDGLNAAGGNDGSSVGGRPGQGGFESTTGSITLQGGTLLVNAQGDGIDANGSLAVSGGLTLVSGPTNGGNGALDYATTATVTGGVFVALGARGMAQGFTSAQGQGAALVSFSSQSGPLALCGEEGRALLVFDPPKDYETAVISCPQMEKNASYRLVGGFLAQGLDENGFAQDLSVSGGTALAQFTLSDWLYGTTGGGMGPGGRPPVGGMGPGRPGGRF